jgi:hypothetical protein
VWWSFGCGALLNILNVLLLKGRGKMPGTEIQLTPSESSGIFAESRQASITPEATRVRTLNFNYCVFR